MSTLSKPPPASEVSHVVTVATIAGAIVKATVAVAGAVVSGAIQGVASGGKK